VTIGMVCSLGSLEVELPAGKGYRIWRTNATDKMTVDGLNLSWPRSGRDQAASQSRP
jgi:hypothetical protein